MVSERGSVIFFQNHTNSGRGYQRKVLSDNVRNQVQIDCVSFIRSLEAKKTDVQKKKRYRGWGISKAITESWRCVLTVLVRRNSAFWLGIATAKSLSSWRTTGRTKTWWNRDNREREHQWWPVTEMADYGVVLGAARYRIWLAIWFPPSPLEDPW